VQEHWRWRHPRVFEAPAAGARTGNLHALRELAQDDDGSDSLGVTLLPLAVGIEAEGEMQQWASTRFNSDFPSGRQWWHTLPGRTQPRDAAASHHPSGTYKQRYQGHHNHDTIKGVTFLGPRSELVVSGCDSGHIFFYGARSGRVLHVVKGDSEGAVNCLTPHPLGLPMLLTSGLEHSAKVWAPMDCSPQLTDAQVAALCAANNVRREHVRETALSDDDEDDEDEDDDDDDEVEGAEAEESEDVDDSEGNDSATGTVSSSATGTFSLSSADWGDRADDWDDEF